MLFLNEEEKALLETGVPLLCKKWRLLKNKRAALDAQIKNVEADMREALDLRRWADQRAKLIAAGWREITGTDYIGHMDDEGRVASLCDRKHNHWPLKVLMSTGRLKGSTKLAPVLVPPEVLRASLA